MAKHARKSGTVAAGVQDAADAPCAQDVAKHAAHARVQEGASAERVQGEEKRVAHERAQGDVSASGAYDRVSVLGPHDGTRSPSVQDGASATDQVVVGTEGWLYYSATLDDYQRTQVISDRAADNAAFNLALVQEYVQAHNASFLVTIAPNKNSLYPEYMPFYEVAGEGASSAEVLREKLRAYSVRYLDLFEVLSDAATSDAPLYMRTDTHWNTEGARIAYDAILSELGIEHFTYEDEPTLVDDAFVGDIEAMLFPLGRTPEPVEVYDAAQRFTYENDATQVEDSLIVTRSTASDAQGSLLMFRDSFGNALLPFFATEFANACFSKLVPYNMLNLSEYQADCVIIERAERHLSFFATDPAIMPAPIRQGIAVTGAETSSSTIQVSENGPYTQVEGLIDPAFASEGQGIYVRVRSASGACTVYEAFHRTVEGDATVSAEAGASASLGAGTTDASDGASALAGANDYGYICYLTTSALPKGSCTIELVSAQGGTGIVLASTTISLPEA